MDCDLLRAGENLKLAASYKDVVMGGFDSHHDEDLISIDDDDIDLLDEDVHVGVTDGVPFIDFSTRVQDLAIISFELTIVLKMLGHRLSRATPRPSLVITSQSNPGPLTLIPLRPIRVASWLGSAFPTSQSPGTSEA
ncbi:hypothetical protein V6N11_060253 [Hibiscus sabdariffa]|uniref:Uncharacterized protein n=1 Tax=Hibiscus sabdariffa TaxID=183260 RepID=A0ABR2QPS0_9ROSI